MFLIVTIISVILTYWADNYMAKYWFKPKSLVSTIWKIQSCFFISLILISYVWGIFTNTNNVVKHLFSIWVIWLFFLQLVCKLFICIALLMANKSKNRKNALKVYMPVAIVITIVFAFVLIYGNFVSRKNFVINRVEIVSDKIPESFDGYRIVQFSDTHVGTMWLDNNLLERMVDTINSINPDIIFQTGDLVNIHVNELTEYRRNVFKRLKAPVYAVLGNHDLGFYIKDTVDESPKITYDSLRFIEKNEFNWILLENEHTFVYKNGDSIAIAGVRYPKNLNHNNFNSLYGGSDIHKAMTGISKQTFSILLSHNPKLIDSLPEKSDAVDFVVSGHTHAMQLKIGKMYSPAKYLYPEYSGLYNKNGIQLYVNDGIGVVGYPFRFGAPPEITIFTLKSTKNE